MALKFCELQLSGHTDEFKRSQSFGGRLIRNSHCVHLKLVDPTVYLKDRINLLNLDFFSKCHESSSYNFAHMLDFCPDSFTSMLATFDFIFQDDDAFGFSGLGTFAVAMMDAVLRLAVGLKAAAACLAGILVGAHC